MNAIQGAVDCNVISDKYHVGTVGFPTDDLEQDTKDHIEEMLENDHDCLTVFVTDADLDGHYRQFCKTILWPGRPK